MGVNADAVVIGAGVIGSSIAHQLSGTGRRVVVVDRLGGPGQGSTSASSAVVRFTYSTLEGVSTAWESMHHWARWAEHLGVPDDRPLARFHRTGLVMLDVPIAPSAPTLRLFDRVGVPYEQWDAQTLAARVPQLDTGRYWPPKSPADERFWADATDQLTAYFTPDAGYVDDPLLAAVNLADAARARGTDFWFRREVVAVTRQHGRVTGVDLADGTHVDAPVVVNVGGPWSTALNRLAGVGDDFTMTVRPMRQEVHHVKAPRGYNGAERPGPVITDMDLGTYLFGVAGDGLVVGSTEPECDELEWLDEPEQALLAPTVPVFERQVTRAARRLPELGVPSQPRGIAGVYDVSQDWTPVYDRTSLDGYYVAMGTSGNQFKNAPVVGMMMTTLVDAVSGGHDHDRDPVRFTAPRTGLEIDLGAFSRRRVINTASTNTVLG